MRRQNIVVPLILVMVLSLVLVQCGPAQTPSPTQPSAPTGAAAPTQPPAPTEVAAPPEKIRVALLLPGSIGDAGWNANAYKGLQEIAAQGIETAYTESIPIPDIEAAFRGYAEQGYTLIIGHGFEFGEPALKVAPDFPNVFFHVSGKAPPNVEIPKNVGFLDQQEFQGAYLCGVLAGLMTKTNKVGYVGGMEIPPQLANLAAFTKGAQSVNPNVEILGVLTGTFEDPEKGREAAMAQIGNGIDILMQTADSTGMGAIQAAKEKGIYIIGYGGDQSEIAPDLFLTSLVVNNPKAIALQVDRIKQGTFGGSVWVAGIKEGIIDIAPFGPMVPKEVQDQIMALRQDIIDGKFIVPEIYERIDQGKPSGKVEEIRVALLLPGSIGDAGWNANAYKGLQEIAAQGIETAYTESIPIPDIEAAFRGYAEQGYTLIIGHGFEFGEPALKVAPDFPNVFFHVSGKAPPNVEIPKNVGFLDQQEFQGAYLCGVLAGLMTKTNKVGYVGGMEIPPQLANLAAFTKGAQSVNPNVEILGVLTGTFEDPEKGREAAMAQIGNGIDILMQTADSTGMGAIQAAKEKGIYIIGYGGDQSEIAPDLFLTSLVVNNPKAIALQVDRIKQGTFGGSVWVAGIKEGIIDIAPFGPMVPKEVQDQIMALRQDIIDGKFIVPEIYERID